MKSFHFIFLLNLISISAFSQSLILKQGDRQKILKADSFYEIIHSKTNFQSPDSCCGYVKITGSINKIYRDSIELKTKDISSRIKLNDVTFDHHFISNSGKPTTMIAKNDINSLRNYKSFKKYKTREKFIAPGGILVFAAGITLINVLVVKGKTSKDNLLKFAAGEFAVGMTFLIIHNSKNYHFKDVDDPWSFSN